MRLITESEVRSVLTPELVFDAVKEVFNNYAKGTATMPSKVYLDMPTPGDDYRAMPASTSKYAGIKWIADYGSNSKRNIQTTNALIILNNKHTGQPLSVIEGNFITQCRTAATTALTTEAVLNGDNVDKMAFIGCGFQTMAHVQFLMHVVKTKHISIYDINVKKAQDFAKSLGKTFEKISVCNSVEEAIEGCRVITTLTPSRKPYINNSMLDKPVHINAVGCDSEGKRELNDDVLFDCSTLIYDDKEQASHSGESQYRVGPTHMHRNTHLKEYELKDLLRWPSQTLSDKIQKNLSIFDSTGLAIEDIALAQVVYDKLNK